jgi:hypothetical protein
MTRDLNGRQNRQAQEYDRAHYNPVWGYMQKDGAINQPTECDQKPKDVKSE